MPRKSIETTGGDSNPDPEKYSYDKYFARLTLSASRSDRLTVAAVGAFRAVETIYPDDESLAYKFGDPKTHPEHPSWYNHPRAIVKVDDDQRGPILFDEPPLDVAMFSVTGDFTIWGEAATQSSELNDLIRDGITIENYPMLLTRPLGQTSLQEFSGILDLGRSEKIPE